MKKIISYIVSGIVILLFGLFLFLPKNSFSENENRYLEKLPDVEISGIFDGSFMEKVNNYVTDHFPFRENLLTFKTKVLKTVGVNKQNGVYFIDDGLVEEYKKPINFKKIVSIVNKFSEKTEADVSFMLVPTSIYVKQDKISKYNTSYDEDLSIDYIKDNLKINFIDVRDKLMENKDEYLFYRSDHHWTMLGANVAYQEFCRQEGLTARKYRFSKVNEEFLGTLYSKVLDDSIKKDIIYTVDIDSNYEVFYEDSKRREESIYSLKYLEKKDKYSYYLDNNHALITITNNDLDEGEILIIKDSYANSFIPLLVKHYRKIHVIDPRYYKDSISEYIEENDIDKVLLLYNVLTIDSDLGIFRIR